MRGPEEDTVILRFSASFLDYATYACGALINPIRSTIINTCSVKDGLAAMRHRPLDARH